MRCENRLWWEGERFPWQTQARLTASTAAEPLLALLRGENITQALHGKMTPVALQVDDEAVGCLFHDPGCTQRHLPAAEARHKRERTIEARSAPCQVTSTAALLATAGWGLVRDPPSPQRNTCALGPHLDAGDSALFRRDGGMLTQHSPFGSTISNTRRSNKCSCLC